MKHDTFTGLIDTMEDYYNKAEQFGRAMSDALIEAGGEEDFKQPYAYTFPLGKLFDNMVKYIAEDFAEGEFTSEMAEDTINWWMWECEFGKATYYDWSHDESGLSNDINVKPAAVMTINNVEFIVRDASTLYTVLMFHRDYVNSKKTETDK